MSLSKVWFVRRIQRNLTKPEAQVSPVSTATPGAEAASLPPYVRWTPTAPQHLGLQSVCLSVSLSLCLFYLSLHFSPCLSVFVSVRLSLSYCECVAMCVGMCVSLYLVSPWLFLCFSLFMCEEYLCAFICLCPSVCLSLHLHCLLHCFLWHACFLLPLLSLLLCTHDETWLFRSHFYNTFQFTCLAETDHQLRIPVPNSWGRWIWLAQPGSGVNSAVAREAWSRGRKASSTIKMTVCYWSTEH